MSRERNLLESTRTTLFLFFDSTVDPILLQLFRGRWIKTIDNDDLWNPEKKPVLLNSFMDALFEDELALAEKYKDVRGIDWEKYFSNKKEAGFAKKADWNFIDSREVFVQTDSKWLKPYLKENECVWSRRIEGKGSTESYLIVKIERN